LWEPILPGYVFVRSVLELTEYLGILRIPGWVWLVGFEGRPVFADDSEIASPMTLDGTDRTVQNRAYNSEGDRVMIMAGPLKEFVGLCFRHKQRKGSVVVSVERLQRSLAVEIDDWDLERVP
jgi:transcription antitermination factor NusG